MNKTDLIDEDTLGTIEGFIEHLNPHALKLRSTFGRIEPSRIMGTGRFDFEIAKQSKGWQLTLRDDGASEVEEYGIASFVYRSRRPFHPQRFHDLLNQDWEGVLRSKGFFWLATRLEKIGVWSQAGRVARLDFGGFWWIFLGTLLMYVRLMWVGCRPFLMSFGGFLLDFGGLWWGVTKDNRPSCQACSAGP